MGFGCAHQDNVLLKLYDHPSENGEERCTALNTPEKTFLYYRKPYDFRKESQLDLFLSLFNVLSTFLIKKMLFFSKNKNV